MQGRRTPDFKLVKDGKLQGYCEMKSPRDDWIFDIPQDLKVGELREEKRFALEGIQVPGGGRGFFIFDEKKDQRERDKAAPDDKQKAVWEAARSIDLYLWIEPQKK